MSACFEIPTISSSHILRSAIGTGSVSRGRVEAVMRSGGLVPDEVINELVFDRLAQPDTFGGFVLDGFPRTAAQAEALDQFVGDPAVVAIVLEVPETHLKRRLTIRRVCSRCRTPQSHSSHHSGQRECAYCGATLERRDDDHEATIKRRLFAYRSTVQPLLSYYKRRARLIEIDATANPREVSAEIERQIVLRDAGRTKVARSISVS